MASADFSHSTLIESLPGLGEPATACVQCHVTGGAAPTIAKIHNGGYDPKIYTSAGVRYSDTFVVTIDSVSIAASKLTIKFSATGALTSPVLSATSITPTVLVGLYGYDSKDFLVAAHGRDADRNRLLEYVVGTSHPRFTTVSASNGSWEVTADLSMWSDKLASGEVRRAEIAVMPELKDATGLVLGLNAPSRTFELGTNSFNDTYFPDIVDVKGGCNTCHDQLATTFHSGTRGGNIKVCRICHEVSSAGSHLELQSRSIDSYVHAVHSFQAFDPGDIDFGNPEESVEYQHHINSEFPRFGILNCESCHGVGKTPNVPDQAKSMPGVLSGTDDVEGRKIGSLPASVTGPAVRACGGCHRAQVINADDASGLAVLTQHWKTFGYSIDEQPGKPGGDTTSIWEATVAKIMGVFK
jgi:OmcA/MtrC family decaheme c-type cytochrome